MCFYNLEIYFNICTYWTVFSHTTVFTSNNCTVFSHTTICNNNITVQQYVRKLLNYYYILSMVEHTYFFNTHKSGGGVAWHLFFLDTNTREIFFARIRLLQSVFCIKVQIHQNLRCPTPFPNNLLLKSEGSYRLFPEILSLLIGALSPPTTLFLSK